MKKEEETRVRITEAMAVKMKKDGEWMTKSKLAQQIWPNASRTSALTLLANYDNGHIKRVDISVLRKLSSILKVDFNFLLNYGK
jgi:hypothetical protein